MPLLLLQLLPSLSPSLVFVYVSRQPYRQVLSSLSYSGGVGVGVGVRVVRTELELL